MTEPFRYASLINTMSSVNYIHPNTIKPTMHYYMHVVGMVTI